MKGYCNNPRSYYYGTQVDSEFFAEECGKTCGSCLYFYSPDTDPIIQIAEQIIYNIKAIKEEIEIIDKQIRILKGIEKDKVLDLLINELEEKKVKALKKLKDLEHQLREFRKDLEYSEKPLF